MISEHVVDASLVTDEGRLRMPVQSVGLVCSCGTAVSGIEGVTITCECGRVWLISVMEINRRIEIR